MGMSDAHTDPAPLAASLRALADDELAALTDAMVLGVEEGRRRGYPAVAAWWDALGRLIDAERDRRAGDLAPDPVDPAAVLTRAAGALGGRELAAVFAAITATLYELPPDTPSWAFLEALLRLVAAERRRAGAA